MAMLAEEMDLPYLDLMPIPDRNDQMIAARAVAEQHWLARSAFGYVVTHYDDVVAVLRDKRWHNAAGKIAQMSGVTNPEYLSRQRISILSAEGDMHTRLRRLVAPAFSPRSADRLRPFMREVVNGLIDPVAASGRAEIVSDICEPYPIPIICELLGAPKSDWQLFSRWATDVLRVFNFDFANDLPIIMKAQDELTEYTEALIAERRSKPAEDLITDLIAAEEAGDRLSTEELVMMVQSVIVGGTDTTRNQLSCSVGLFSEHPDQWALLAERPELAPRAVEETMRVIGAVRGTGRFASEDIVYRDVLFPAGTFVSPSLATANRDPAVFTDANTFDITREPSGQPMLTLGSGIHYCLGAALARAELQEALPTLAQRMPNLRVDGTITWKPNGVGIWGAQHLPVTFDAS
jgi:cytochrome P450